MDLGEGQGIMGHRDRDGRTGFGAKDFLWILM